MDLKKAKKYSGKIKGQKEQTKQQQQLPGNSLLEMTSLCDTSKAPTPSSRW